MQTWWFSGFSLACFVNHKKIDLGKAVVYVECTFNFNSVICKMEGRIGVLKCVYKRSLGSRYFNVQTFSFVQNLATSVAR